MRSAMKNYMGMIAIGIMAVLVIGAVGVRIDRAQERQPPAGINATPAISGNAPAGLVDTRWLMQYRNQVDYILDLSDIRQFESGHIPGAQHVWWQDAMGRHPENYAEPDRISLKIAPNNPFENLNLHVPQNARIIVYDNNNSERASWMLWVMTINGYTDVHILDGGLSAWIGAGGELATESEDTRDHDHVATPTWNEQTLIHREPLLELLDEPDVHIIDTRSSEEQLDTVNGTIREGHIPGAINIPTAEVMREDGTFRSGEELRNLFQSHGIEPGDTIVVYSLFAAHSGNVWMALQIAGYDQVMIYQDGYAGWAMNDDLPIDTEPFPTREPEATVVPATPVSTPLPTPVSTPVGTPISTPTDDGPTDLT